MPSPDELLTQPEYFLHTLNLAAGECEFLKLDKAAFRRLAFMDQRIQPGSWESARVSLDIIGKLVADRPIGPASKPINYIFHTAFCCSTLISRCLDIEGICYALREPQVLMQLANYKRLRSRNAPEAAPQRNLLDTVLFLLAKSAADGETTVIKPTNAANNLLAEMARHSRTRGVLLLYSSLEQFLVSIIKKGEEGRAFVRKLFNVIRKDSERTSALPLESLAQLTDLQIAAFVWYLQMEVYLKVINDCPEANIRTLNCDVFLADPMGILLRVCELFGIKIDGATLATIIAGPVFKKNSKNDTQDYDSAVRKDEYSQILQQQGATIKGILAWSEGIRPEGPLTLPLPRPL